jgi:hypothetical protein
MSRWIVVCAVAAGAFAAGAFAQAKVSWKPFASGSATSQYYSYATASSDVLRPGGLAIKGTAARSKTVKVTYFVSCNGEANVRSGSIYEVTVVKAPKCSLNGSAASASGGKVTVTLLKAR